MANENGGLFSRLFNKKGVNTDHSVQDKEPMKKPEEIEKTINRNRDRGNQVAKTLETLTARAGLSDKLGTPLQREKRVANLHLLRDEFINMPPINLDITDFDKEVVSCLRQLGGSVEAGDILSFEHSYDGMTYAVKVRAQATEDSVTVMRLYVNRSALSIDMFNRKSELALQEKILSEVVNREKNLSAMIDNSGKKPSELRMEYSQLQNIEEQKDTVITVINMLKTTITEAESMITSSTVHINGSGMGDKLTTAQLDEIIQLNQKTAEQRLVDYKHRIQIIEEAHDKDAALTNAAKDAVNDYYMNTIGADKLFGIRVETESTTSQTNEPVPTSANETLDQNVEEELKKAEMMFN